MEAFVQDLRYAARKLAASPGFTAVAVVTLALAIGASTAVFSVVNGVLLAPLPYAQPDRLVLLWNRMTASSFERAPVSAPDVAEYRERARRFSGIAATNNVQEGTLTGGGPPEQIKIGGVTANFFEVLGADPLHGRTFRPEDEAPPAPPPADPQAAPPPPSPTAMVLAHGFWQRRFGGDPAIVGQTVSINGFPSLVVGVMRPDFRLLMPADAGMPTDIDAWQPLRFDLATGARDQQFLRVVARLAPGTTLAAAQQEMDSIAERHRAEHPFHENMGIHVVVRPMAADVVEGVRPVLLALLGAVGFVLLIACFNVANLMLARSAVRGRETAVRAALGAGRWRIARQVLAEGVVLAVAGGLAGVGLAWAGLRALLALRPPDLPRVDEVGLDPAVLAFSCAVTLAAALLSSLLPALELSGTRPYQALKEGGAGASRRLRLRGALVVAEVALSLVLLVGAGLMMRSFLELQRVRPGFEPEGAVAYNLSLPFATYGTPDDRVGFFQRMEREVEALPAVEAAGAVFPMPLGGRFWTGPYGQPGESPEEWSKNEGNFRVATPGFFEAMGARLVAGRTLETADLEQRRNVAVVDTRMAARAFGDRPAVGERLGVDLFGNPLELEVVGVVEHMRHESLAEDDRETVYFPHHLFPFTPLTVVARASGGDPTALVPAIRREIERLDPELPIYGVRPLTAYVAEAMAQTRFATVLIAVFAAVAVVLAAVGLFGVVAYAVRQRTREIGIRVALGAEKASILRLVVGRGLGLVGAGVVLGLIAAFALTRTLASLLYGVGPRDPATFAAIPLLLAVIALAASWLPARRAAALDPMRTLRVE